MDQWPLIPQKEVYIHLFAVIENKEDSSNNLMKRTAEEIALGENLSGR